jgi:uncharacterized membrane protein
MAEATKPRRRKRAADPEEQLETATDTARETTEEVGGSAGQAAAGVRGDKQPQTITGELRNTFREAAIEVLRPVAREATKKAAKAAITKGPALVKDRVGPMVDKAGGADKLAKGTLEKGGGLAGGIAEKLPGVGKLAGGKGDKAPSGTGRGRRLPVQEFVDVAVPIEVAYDQFTQFEEFPKFMHRVEKIEQRDDSTLMWHENIWGVRRSWEAEILEQQPCERLVWRSTGGPQTVGVVTFHELSDRLTRVYVNLDFQPKGLFEKTASGFRMSRRALKSDLMRFKAFIEMRDEPTGAWRGMIEGGDVTSEDAGRDGGRARREEPEGRGAEEEPRDEEYEEAEEEEERPRPRSRRVKRSEEEEPEAEEEEVEGEAEVIGEAEDEEEQEEAPVKTRTRARRRAPTRRRR